MSKKGHILIVDDTMQNIQVLGTVLREADYRVDVAMNGLEALKQVERISPDLIMLDIMMPELDGIETCQRLKADDRTKDIPVIFLTALTEVADRTRGLNAGGADLSPNPSIAPSCSDAWRRTCLSIWPRRSLPSSSKTSNEGINCETRRSEAVIRLNLLILLRLGSYVFD